MTINGRDVGEVEILSTLIGATISDTKRNDLFKSLKVITSGYGGVLPDGRVVDRREFPTAVPLKENKFLGTPKPLPV